MSVFRQLSRIVKSSSLTASGSVLFRFISEAPSSSFGSSLTFICGGYRELPTSVPAQSTKPVSEAQRVKSSGAGLLTLNLCQALFNDWRNRLKQSGACARVAESLSADNSHFNVFVFFWHGGSLCGFFGAVFRLVQAVSFFKDEIDLTRSTSSLTGSFLIQLFKDSFRHPLSKVNCLFFHSFILYHLGIKNVNTSVV